MALIVMTGYPCSGKSALAADIAEWVKGNDPSDPKEQVKQTIEQKKPKGQQDLDVERAEIVEESQTETRLCSLSLSSLMPKLTQVPAKQTHETVHVVTDQRDPEVAYQTSQSEKIERGELKSAVERLLTKQSVVIVDSLNYIKGFRYELFCVAKALGIPHCVVHCGTPSEICEQRNAGIKRYHDDLFRQLVFRYEQPNSLNRWDKPLLVVLPEDPFPSVALNAALFSSGKVKPNFSTQSRPVAPSNFLNELDTVTKSIIMSLVKQQDLAVVGDQLVVPSTNVKVSVKRKMTMAGLRKARRQFLAYTTSHPCPDVAEVGTLFVQYLNNTLT